MARRAGCRCVIWNLASFHPTAFIARRRVIFSLPKLRGEGAYLKRPDGSRFMPDVDERRELAPRQFIAARY
ncbi:FAD-binding protein [Salmonella enterica subsp. enterica]|nr:FAD-binding protein [Salmonella enterica subsp. enterica]